MLPSPRRIKTLLIVKLFLQLDGMNKNELQEVLVKYDIKSPLTGNPLTEPIEFNLMFGTQIGPTGNIKG